MDRIAHRPPADKNLSPEGFLIEAMLSIATKNQEDVPFILNPAQRRLDMGLGARTLVPKARQTGVSSYALARLFVKCLSKRNTRAVVVSHDQESTQRMLRRVTYYLKHIDGPAPQLKNMSANELTFPETDSMFYIGTAGSREFGRGDTITDLLGTEIAFWPKPQSLMRGLLQAVPTTGSVILESTGNGLNYYYRLCMQASKGQNDWRLHFIPWHEFPEYVHELTPEEEQGVVDRLDPDLEEDKLIGRLTPGQISWRREKLRTEFDYSLKDFKQEYPMDLEECFQASGNSFFWKTNYEPTEEWQRQPTDPKLHILQPHPRDDRRYAMGVDPSGGTGLDDAAIEIISLEDNRQVAEWLCNTTPPDLLVGKILELGRLFNSAYVTVERNNHGLVVLSYLRDAVLAGEYPAERVYAESVSTTNNPVAHLGFYTSHLTKPLLLGRARKLLAEGFLFHSENLSTELSTFVEKEGGKLEAEDGCWDDAVIAIALALWARDKAALILPRDYDKPKPMDTNPLLFDNILESLKHKHTKFPIAAQHTIGKH